MGGMKAILLDVLDASSLLALSVRKIDALVRDNLIPHVVLPNDEIRFIEEDLKDWIEGQKQNQRSKQLVLSKGANHGQ